MPYQKWADPEISSYDVIVADNDAFHLVAAVVDSVNNRCILYLDGNVVRRYQIIDS